MKFLQILAVIILLVCVIDCKKSHKKHTSKQSQFGRNYRKVHPNPSYNPLPREYETGPLTNYAPITPKKYRAYNRYISEQNRYLETTGSNAQIASGKPVAYNLNVKNRVSKHRANETKNAKKQRGKEVKNEKKIRKDKNKKK